MTTLLAEFKTKMWHRYPVAYVFSLLAIVNILLGPLYLTGILKPADGRPGQQAGIFLTCLAVPFTATAVLMWSQLLAFRRPLIRIYDDGIEVNFVGPTQLDNTPLIHPLMRIAWSVLSGQGFKQRIGWIPWEHFAGAQIVGPPMMRCIILHGNIFFTTVDGDRATEPMATSVTMRDADFCVPLEVVAEALRVQRQRNASQVT